VRAEVDGDDVMVTVVLPRVHVRGEARQAGELIVGSEAYPATLTANSRGATVRGRLPAPTRWRPVKFQFLGRSSRAAFTLAPGRHGLAVFPARSSDRRLGHALRRLLRALRRRVGQLRRRLLAPG
jgi:hypothetical protein